MSDPLNFGDPDGMQAAPIPSRPMDWGIDPGQTSDAVGSFLENYFDLKNRRDGRFDKYHHCKANCEAAQAGIAGERVAGELSDLKEHLDQELEGDSDAACEKDQEANRHGRDYSRNNSGGSCSSGCAGFLP